MLDSRRDPKRVCKHNDINIYIIIHLSYIPFKSRWDLPRTENVSTDARCLRRWCSKRPCLPTRRPSRVQCWGIRRVNTIDPNLALRQENSASAMHSTNNWLQSSLCAFKHLQTWKARVIDSERYWWWSSHEKPPETAKKDPSNPCLGEIPKLASVLVWGRGFQLRNWR